MFNVGDEVIMVYSSAITKEGDIGVIVRKDPYAVTIKFSSMQKKNYIGEEFTVPPILGRGLGRRSLSNRT